MSCHGTNVAMEIMRFRARRSPASDRCASPFAWLRASESRAADCRLDDTGSGLRWRRPRARSPRRQSPRAARALMGLGSASPRSRWVLGARPTPRRLALNAHAGHRQRRATPRLRGPGLHGGALLDDEVKRASSTGREAASEQRATGLPDAAQRGSRGANASIRCSEDSVPANAIQPPGVVAVNCGAPPGVNRAKTSSMRVLIPSAVRRWLRRTS